MQRHLFCVLFQIRLSEFVCSWAISIRNGVTLKPITLDSQITMVSLPFICRLHDTKSKNGYFFFGPWRTKWRENSLLPAFPVPQLCLGCPRPALPGWPFSHAWCPTLLPLAGHAAVCLSLPLKPILVSLLPTLSFWQTDSCPGFFLCSFPWASGGPCGFRGLAFTLARCSFFKGMSWGSL